MKIHSSAPPRSDAVRRRGRGRQGNGDTFASQFGEEPTTPSAALGGATRISALDSLLALQEVDERAEQERQATEQGHDLLDQLEELRLGLLTGTISRSRIEYLTSSLQLKKATVRDPELAQILAEIELRAAVELAKLEA